MKKRAAILLAVCAAAAVGLAVVLLKEPDPVRPFQDLKGEDIASASVELLPPGETVEVEDLEELAALLREAVVYEKDDSYGQYAGQAVTFTLTMADGTETRIMAYTPFLVLDGVGYRAEYEPCEALNAYANLLLEGPAVTRKEPPTCAVESGGASVQAMRGGFSWTWESEEGMEAMIADSAHPLDCQELLPPFRTSSTGSRMMGAYRGLVLRGVSYHRSRPRAKYRVLAPFSSREALAERYRFLMAAARAVSFRLERRRRF